MSHYHSPVAEYLVAYTPKDLNEPRSSVQTLDIIRTNSYLQCETEVRNATVLCRGSSMSVHVIT